MGAAAAFLPLPLGAMSREGEISRQIGWKKPAKTKRKKERKSEREMPLTYYDIVTKKYISKIHGQRRKLSVVI